MKTRDLILCAVFAAIIAVLAQISIPLPGGVPLTMQTLAVGLAGVILKSKKGFISVLIYILMGTIGIPVFANFTGGIGIVLGPTGGFIIAFPIMAFIIGLVSEKTNKRYLIFIGFFIGTLVTYTIGTIQFSIVTGESIYKGILLCVAPFIVTDLIKGTLVSVLGETLKEHKGIKRILNYDRA
ncbi:biotin transporter BioY [uncultured Clostridium sp.]|uniref:biotin transporter BioY n=1 Tax=uncultured Clostridium sp. TaxID=59620 RepID=UPI00261EAEE0|nr:biotin transporter BioY [uncultured Clostridium sp.]